MPSHSWLALSFFVSSGYSVIVITADVSIITRRYLNIPPSFGVTFYFFSLAFHFALSRIFGSQTYSRRMVSHLHIRRRHTPPPARHHNFQCAVESIACTFGDAWYTHYIVFIVRYSCFPAIYRQQYTYAYARAGTYGTHSNTYRHIKYSFTGVDFYCLLHAKISTILSYFRIE